MKANEFVKKHGWDSLLIARMLPKFNRYKYVIFYADEIDFSNEFHAGRKSYMFEVAEVKRLIESWELIEKHQGLNGARNVLKLLGESLDIGLYHGIDSVDATTEVPKIKQAIADVESCQ